MRQQGSRQQGQQGRCALFPAWLRAASAALSTPVSACAVRLAACMLLCIRYVKQQVMNATGEPLSKAEASELDFAAQLASSSTHKARLLHYFPVDHSKQQQQQQQWGQLHRSGQQQQAEDWCGWHLDHGSLTGEGGWDLVEQTPPA